MGKHPKIALGYGILAFWVDPARLVVVGAIMTTNDVITSFNSLT